MPPLRTDDGPRKLRAVWLGPKGGTLPFEWTYVQWSATLAAMAVTSTMAFLIALILPAPAWFVGFAYLSGGGIGVYLAVKAMRNVTFDEPLRHKTATVRAEFSRRRRPAQQATAWVWADLPVNDLSPQAAQLLFPRKDA